MSTSESRTSPKTLVWGMTGLLAAMILIAAGRWLGPMAEGQHAMQEGRLQAALERYGTAERRLAGSAAGRRLLPSLRDRAVSNELSLMYSLKQYDEVIDRAGAVESAAARFWAGCALFAKADVDISDKNRLTWMAQAQREFRRAIEANPDDFDARFNYELTGRLIAGMKKDPLLERPKDLQMLTPSSAQAPRKVS
ncbi:MAG: hypothetical protein AB7Q29_16180 [Vicinamibacterales bacterium]